MLLPQNFCYYLKKNSPLPEPNLITLNNLIDIVKAGTLKSDDDIKNQIATYRATKNKELKNDLPLVILSGTYGLYHATDTLVANTFTGYITLDIDHITIAQIDYFIKVLRTRMYIHALFISPSDEGLKVVVRAEIEPNEDTFKLAYRAIYEHVKGDITKSVSHEKSPVKFDTIFPNGFPDVDENAGKLAQGCYISHDVNAFINEKPSTFTADEVNQMIAHYGVTLGKPASKPSKVSYHSDSDKAKIVLQHIINVLKTDNKSITNSYDKWFSVGCAIKSSLGVDGLKYFDEISQRDKTYNKKEVENFYKGLDIKEIKHSLGTVIYYAINEGIKLPSDVLKSSYNDIQHIENYLKSNYKFRTNIITGGIEIAKHNKVTTWQPVTDSDYNIFYTDLKQRVIHYTYKKIVKGESIEVEASKYLKITMQDVVCTINNINFSPAVNPIIERFEQLHYKYFINANNVLENDLSEVEKWIKVFTYNDTYQRDYWLNWFSGVIKNLTTSGYYDRILVLGGMKGAGKTHAITQCLTAPFGEYVTSDFGWNTKDKDDIKRISSNLFVFDDELKTSRKSDVETIKAVLSKTKIDYRAPYARTSTTSQRIATFIATTNENEMLTDLTGNRRFLVLNVSAGDRKLMNSIDYQRLWAQVWNYFYVNKNKHDISDDKIDENNNKYRMKSIEEDTIDSLFSFDRIGNDKPGRADNPEKVFTTVELITFINQNQTDVLLRVDNPTKNKVGKILNHKGLLIQKDARHNGRKSDFWYMELLKPDRNQTQPNVIDDEFFNLDNTFIITDVTPKPNNNTNYRKVDSTKMNEYEASMYNKLNGLSGKPKR